VGQGKLKGRVLKQGAFLMAVEKTFVYSAPNLGGRNISKLFARRSWPFGREWQERRGEGESNFFCLRKASGKDQ